MKGVLIQSKSAMKIDHLELDQFRNINHASLDFTKNINVFVGNNGQGKTNVIESIVFLSSIRSFRINDDKKLIRFDHDFAKVEASLQNKDKLSIVISESGKYLKLNQKVLKKSSEIIGVCNVVLFCPDDLNFFSNPPRKRRREFDFELGKISVEYLNLLNRYQKHLNERNALLKKKNIDLDLLEIITDAMVEISVKIIKQRKGFSNKIEQKVNMYYAKLSNTNVKIQLDYQSPVPVDENLAENLKIKMEESKQRDLDFKLTHVGIHRDDYLFKMDGDLVLNVASQGQRRLLILSFKFAIKDIILEISKQLPILCLDDLFSELDRDRRKQVMSLLNEDMQVFITTTDLEFIETKESYDVFKVNNGNVIKEEI